MTPQEEEQRRPYPDSFTSRIGANTSNGAGHSSGAGQ
jgi:hypothetical protein